MFTSCKTMAAKVKPQKSKLNMGNCLSNERYCSCMLRELAFILINFMKMIFSEKEERQDELIAQPTKDAIPIER